MGKSTPDFDIEHTELIKKHSIAAHILKYIFAIFTTSLAIAGYISTHYPINISVQAAGRIEPIDKYAIRSKVSGILHHIHCREDELVQAGSTMAEIRNIQWQQDLARLSEEIRINTSRKKELQLKVKQAQVEHQFQLDAAALGLAELRIRHDHVVAEQNIYTAADRLQRRKPLAQLLPVQLIKATIRDKEAQIELIKRRGTQVEVYQQEITTIQQIQEKLKKEASMIQQEIGRGIIKAHFSGRVTTKNIGRKIGKQVFVGEELFEIASTKGWQGLIFVTEQERSKIQPNFSARVYVKAFPHTEHKVFQGKVKRIGQQPVEQSAIKGAAYPVYLHLSDPWIVAQGDTLYLAEGMSIDAKIIVGQGTIYQIAKNKIKSSFGKLHRVSTNAKN